MNFCNFSCATTLYMSMFVCLNDFLSFAFMNGVLLVQDASDDIQEVEEKKTNGDDNNIMEVQIDDEKVNGEIEEVKPLE